MEKKTSVDEIIWNLILNNLLPNIKIIDSADSHSDNFIHQHNHLDFDITRPVYKTILTLIVLSISGLNTQHKTIRIIYGTLEYRYVS